MAKRIAHKFPLWLHKSGQWCKKHRGQFYYFGTDKEDALKRYATEWDDLKAGRRVRAAGGTVTVADICNHFLTAKQERQLSGDITHRSWVEYKNTCERVIAEFGRNRTASDLSADDFARLRNRMARKYGPVTLANHIQRVRTLFKHGFDCELLKVPIRFGPGFAKPSRRTIRIRRADKALKMIPAADIRKLIDHAPPPLNAMILLAINCGFGQTDCSELPKTALSRAGWIDFRRPKTGAARRAPLWPETTKALEAAIATRPQPLDTADDGLVFLTRFGRRFVRYAEGKGDKPGHRCDSVGQEFNKLAERLKINIAGGFYTLRHVHRTISDGAKDHVAAGLIMGHVDDSIAGQYREVIDDGRLQAVTDTVREWLYHQNIQT